MASNVENDNETAYTLCWLLSGNKLHHALFSPLRKPLYIRWVTLYLSAHSQAICVSFHEFELKSF